MNIGDLKNLIAGYLKKNPYDFLVNGVDTLLIAINNARRTAERLHDFKYSEASFILTLPSASIGTMIPSSIKRVRRVQLPIAGGDYIPIEFMTQDEWLARLRRQAGRTTYDSSLTLAQYGISMENPVAYQRGQALFLVPASQFTFPINVKLDVVQFLQDYIDDTGEDFLTDNAPEYLQWQAIIESNKYWKEFVPRQEGGVEEPQQYADMAWQSLLEWDNSLSQSTSTPAPQPPQSNGKP